MKYSIELIGTGLEIVVGKISTQNYNYFINNKLNIQNYINALVQIPKKYQPFEKDAWFECDDICHLHNVYLNKNNTMLIKENSKKILELKLNSEILENKIELENSQEIYVSEMRRNTCVFIGKSFEKGSFFQTIFESKKIDLKKIKIDYLDVEGEEIVNEVFYDGVKLINNDANTRGQSSEFDLFKAG